MLSPTELHSRSCNIDSPIILLIQYNTRSVDESVYINTTCIHRSFLRLRLLTNSHTLIYPFTLLSNSSSQFMCDHMRNGFLSYIQGAPQRCEKWSNHIYNSRSPILISSNCKTSALVYKQVEARRLLISVFSFNVYRRLNNSVFLLGSGSAHPSVPHRMKSECN